MKESYLTPLFVCEQVRIEKGFAGSANGFDADDDGTIFGNPGDAGNGYGNWDNGSY